MCRIVARTGLNQIRRKSIEGAPKPTRGLGALNW
jgi:hypothetical protein